MDKLKNCAIEVVNKNRAKRLFGKEVDDVLGDKQAHKVIEENLKYFTTTDQKLLREFFDKTGVILAHRIRDKRGGEYCFTMHGYRKKGADGWINQVQDEHIVIYHREPEAVDTDKSERLELRDETFELNYALSTEVLCEPRASRLDRQVEILVALRPDMEFESKGLKQIMQNAFGEIFLLYEDGCVLRDGKEYAANVDSLVRLGVGTKYMVYRDNSIEAIESYCYPGRCEGGFDKIVARDENALLALLKDKELRILVAGDGSDGYIEQGFAGVDDIEFEEDSGADDGAYGGLLIKSGKATIRMRFDDYDSPWFVVV